MPQHTTSHWGETTTSSAADTTYQRTTSRPGLVMAEENPQVIYRRGSRDTLLAARKEGGERFMPPITSVPVETLVTRKVRELSRDQVRIQGAVDKYQSRLESLQAKSDVWASDYYAIVAGINAELQAGTTAGNPVLSEQRNRAQRKLDGLAQGAGYLNELATDISSEASKAGYLQESVRATYSLSGAVKEDHAKLRTLEDSVNQNIVEINRLLTSVNDEINRRTAYLRTESLNMQTLSLAIANGELYGQNMTNTLFKKAAAEGTELFKGKSPMSPGRRPLVIIRFDRADVQYEQPLYSAMNQAMDKYPAARFDLIAVSTSEGNPAEVALAATEARKNGEAVLRSLTQMGLPVERVNLHAANSRDVVNNEVHLYIR